MHVLLRTYLITLSAIMLMLLLSAAELSAQYAEDGEADLAELNLTEKIVHLDGKWEFYPGDLLYPEDFDAAEHPEPLMIKVPGLWSKVLPARLADKTHCGTYRLVTYMPDASLYALHISRIQSAYKVIVNGKLLTEQGKTACKAENAEAFWAARNLTFESNFGENEIIIHVSNFHHKKSGIEGRISVGKPEIISENSWRILGLDIFLIGVLLIMGIYHLGLYFTHKQDLSPLFFAFTMFSSAAFSATVGEILFTNVWENFNWNLLVKINYTSNYARVGFFLLFMAYVFAGKKHRKIAVYLSMVSVAAVLFVAVTPPSIFTQSLFVFLGFAVISLAYMFFILFRAIKQKKDGSIYSLIGMVLLAIAAINDILGELMLIKTFSLTTAGMFAFTFFQAYILALRSARFNNSLEIGHKRLQKLGEIKNGLLEADSKNIDAPLDVISETTGANHGLFFLKLGDKWITEAESSLGKTSSIGYESFTSHEDVQYLKEIVKKSIKEKKDIFLHAPKLKNESYTDYFIKEGINTLYCVYIQTDNQLEAVLYFEDRERNEEIVNEKREVLKTVKAQVGVFIQNYYFYKELQELNVGLEQKVENRTAEITQQTEEISAARDEIQRQNSYLNKAYQEVNLQNSEISDSIKYAKKIQQAILPKRTFISELFPKSFIYYLPKEDLSGDFYWAEKIGREHYFAAVDCTGHGVPGALMSIVADNLLNHAVIEKRISEPAKILDKLQSDIRSRLQQKEGRFESKDGMDLAIIKYLPEENILEYAGAKNPLYHFRKGKFSAFKADRISIGGVSERTKEHRFKNHKIKVESGDTIYLFSDGFQDQLGGKHNRKYMKKNFRELIIKNHKKDFNRQYELFRQELDQWRAGGEQTDDVLIVGIKF